MADPTIKERLEELRAELRAERISYGELAELQGLAEHIEPGDVELLEAAGVPEEDEYLYVQETYVNATERHMIGESDPYESFAKTPGEIYRHALNEYGRCTGKVYVDSEDGPPIHVGWVFEGRDKYEDADETYLREVWVTLHDGPAKRTVSYKHHAIR